MNLKNIIYAVWEDIESYGITDDSPFNYDILKARVITVNNALIKDTWRNKLPIDMCYSYDPDITVECFKDVVIVNGMTFTSDTVLYKATLPALVQEIDWFDISYFGINGLSKNMRRVTLMGYMSMDGNVWTGKEPAYTILGNEAIIKNIPTSGFTKATLVAIREDPTTISTWDSNDEQDFPTPSLYKLQMLTRNEILRSLGRPDLITDAQRQMAQPQKQETNAKDQSD